MGQSRSSSPAQGLQCTLALQQSPAQPFAPAARGALRPPSPAAYRVGDPTLWEMQLFLVRMWGSQVLLSPALWGWHGGSQAVSSTENVPGAGSASTSTCGAPAGCAVATGAKMPLSPSTVSGGDTVGWIQPMSQSPFCCGFRHCIPHHSEPRAPSPHHVGGCICWDCREHGGLLPHAGVG